MKWFIYLFGVVYGIIFISKDFKSSKGFVKQKILHVASLIIFLFHIYASNLISLSLTPLVRQSTEESDNADISQATDDSGALALPLCHPTRAFPQKYSTI